MLRRRVRHVRRARLRTLAWALAAVALPCAACIFDNGKNYQGGGRRDTAGVSPPSSATVDLDATIGSTVKRDAAAIDPDAGAVPLPDASDQ